MLATSLLARISSGVPSARNRPLVHHDDAVGVAEYHVHVVLDDDRGDVPSPHHRDMVSMICAFSCVLTPLVGSSRNSSLGRSA